MNYQSTRGGAANLSFRQVVLEGLAPDGGLFVPQSWPEISSHEIASLAGKPYSTIAFDIISRFVGGDVPELARILDETYKNFHHNAVCPLVQIGKDEWVLELFHGETLAFKDFALQLLGRLFEYFLKGESRKINILGATSGDTGAAAIAGCRGLANMNIFILHPKGKVSDVQRRMMTTIEGNNVFNIAIEGTFDNCQNIVKEIFSDAPLKKKLELTAVNSINWARIVAQVVYYFYAAAALGAPFKKVSFAVPTGNFGDVYAGFVAQKMGLGIEKLIVATNRNDILHRAITKGEYKVAGTQPTISPSMDIQVASNFERVLYELYGRNHAAIRTMMGSLKTTGGFTIDEGVRKKLSGIFASASASEVETKQTIKELHASSGYFADPHTAVGICAGRKVRKATGEPIVYLSTAHPAKFPDAVMAATGVHPALPERMKNLMTMPERMATLPADVTKVKEYITSNAA